MTAWKHWLRSAARLAALTGILASVSAPALATDDLRTLKFYGWGGCRAADGSHGEYTVVTGISFEECKNRCTLGKAKCPAIEYNKRIDRCEIHKKTVASVALGADGRAQNTACYKLK